MNIGDKIKKRRNELGYTLLDVSRKLGVQEATVQRYESGSIKNLKQQTIGKIADILKINPAYLMGWSDDPDANDNVLLNIKQMPQLFKVPVIGSVMAGYNGLAIEEIKGYDYINVHNPEDCVLFEVTGDSMEPKISNGDYAVVRKQSDVENGELAIVIISGEVGTIKRVIKKDGAMMLQPFNINYPTLMFAGEELNEVRIYGKVLKTEKHW